MGRSGQITSILWCVAASVLCLWTAPRAWARTGKDPDVTYSNSLTAAERAAGWRLLFDGRTTAGWREYRQRTIGPNWHVIDGALTFKDSGRKEALGIVSEGQFDSFELMDAEPHPIGEWNRTRIVVDGRHVEHWLNGQRIVDYELHSADWNARRAKGKWKDYPAYGSETKGHICLQEHGSEVAFRSIKIRALR